MASSLKVVGDTPALAGFCRSCAYQDPCGGLDGEPDLFGCFVECGQTCNVGTVSGCDYTCPSRPRQFARRMAEVGGLGFRGPSTPLVSPSRDLPRYVPIIHHHYRRDFRLDVEHVAIPTFCVVRGAAGAYGPSVRDAADLRDRLLLRADANVIFLSVDEDAHLERYWGLATELGVPSRIAPLGLWGMTAPNFSFFDRAPRTHIIYNRARIVRAAESLDGHRVQLDRNASLGANVEHRPSRYPLEHADRGRSDAPVSDDEQIESSPLCQEAPSVGEHHSVVAAIIGIEERELKVKPVVVLDCRIDRLR